MNIRTLLSVSILSISLMSSTLVAKGLPEITSLVEKNTDSVVVVRAKYLTAKPEVKGFLTADNIQTKMSLGSGFIITKDGYILTNHHVVENADSVEVELSDNTEVDAEVVGSDEKYDVALLKINLSGLNPVVIADASKLKSGQWVLALGSPFGFDHTATVGIISKVGRTFGDDDSPYVSFIQTNVAINPGNSGGPLFNTEGQVIGINSQIFSNNGGYVGIAFAIPIDLALNAANQIKTRGYVVRGSLGAQVVSVDRETAAEAGQTRSVGALVTEVVVNGPAEDSGVVVDDIILAFNGTSLVSAADLLPLVGLAIPGSVAELTVLRNHNILKIKVVMAELQEDHKTQTKKQHTLH